MAHLRKPLAKIAPKRDPFEDEIRALKRAWKAINKLSPAARKLLTQRLRGSA